MNNLPKVVTHLLPQIGFNPRPVDRKSNALPVAPPRHLVSNHNVCMWVSKFKLIDKMLDLSPIFPFTAVQFVHPSVTHDRPLVGMILLCSSDLQLVQLSIYCI